MKTSNVTTDHNQAIIRGWVDPVSLPDDAAGSGSGGATQTRNDSGGALVAGDVVVLDTDGNVITTTTAQDTRPVGVVLDDIASGEYGPIAWQGPVPYVNVSASVTAGRYAETSTSAANATENTTRRVGSFGLYTSSGTAPTAFLFGGGGGSGAGGGDVATDAIWDAAGDLAVGTGANTAARLALGSAGGAVSRINGAVAWNSGTAFPTAATGDRFWRTDLGMEFFWNGTRWLSTTLFSESFASQDVLVPVAATSLMLLSLSGIFDYWVERFLCTTQVAATNDGSNYWNIGMTRYPSATVVHSGIVTSADTANTPTRHTMTVGALTGTTDPMMLAAATKTGAPGAMYWSASMQYRLVGT